MVLMVIDSNKAGRTDSDIQEEVAAKEDMFNCMDNLSIR